MDTEDLGLSTLAVPLSWSLHDTTAEMLQESACSVMQHNIHAHSASNAPPKQSAKKNQNTIDPSCQIWCPPAGVCASKSTQIREHARIDLSKEEEDIVTAAIQSGCAEVLPVLF
jgi:hypothetical protein